MKKNPKLFSILIATLLLLLLLPIPVSADDGTDPGQVVFGSSYILESEETITGDLIVIGGSATISRRATVNGDIFIAGGTANISGLIKGDIIAFGGIINILEDAVVTGNVVRYGGVFNLDEDAEISGNIVSNEGEDFDFNFTPENLPSVTTPETTQQLFEGPAYYFQKLGEFMLKVMQVIGLALIAVIVSLVLNKPLERVTKTFEENIALSLGIGLLTVFVFPLLMVIMMITIILIPISVLGLIGFVFLVLYGWFSMALFTGDKIADMFKTDWTNPLSIGIGSLVLSIVSYIIVSVPCVGWVIPFLIASAGLGAAILSRGGSRVYEPEKSNVPSKTVPAIPPTSQVVEKAEATPIIEETSVEEALEPLDLDAIPPLENDGTEEPSEGETNE